MIMKTVIEHMRSLCPISDETVEELMKCVTLCHFPKRYQLIQENKFCKYAYFIEKGMTRSFWLVDGEEITTSFSCEGGIVFSMDELYYNKVSEEFVETLEEVEAYRIALTDYRRLHRSHKERLTLPAKERYEEFQKQFPYVCQRTNLGFIASYLGITLSTLSRIRAASDSNS